MHIAAPEQCTRCVIYAGLPTQREWPHLFTNSLPAVSTILSVLDDRAFGEEVPCLCENIQNSTKGNKADNIVDEGPIGDAI